MDLYQYQLLPRLEYDIRNPRQRQQWFRLATLSPGIGHENTELKLENYELSHAPAYEVLSYCWGPDEGQNQVIVNSFFGVGLLRIRPNLREALLRLRFPDLHRRLWIDAICINQEDNDEKGVQVQMMRDIYGHANRTIVWLGVGDETTNATFELAKRISIVRAQDDSALGDVFGHSYRMGQSKERDVSERGIIAQSAWEGLERVYSSDWFSRIWVVQEGTQDFQSTDTRDKVFALIGMSTEGSDELYAIKGDFDPRNSLSFPKRIAWHAVTKAVKPLQSDQNKSVQEVYRDITRYLICKIPPKLDIISMVHHNGDPYQDGFPSWVPRFDKHKNVRFPIRASGCYMTSRTVVTSERLGREQIDPNCLHLQGVYLDVIHSMSHEMSSNETSSHFSPERIWSEISPLDIYFSDRQLYFNGEPLDIAFGMAMIGGEIGAFQALMAVGQIKRDATDFSAVIDSKEVLIQSMSLFRNFLVAHTASQDNSESYPREGSEEETAIRLFFMAAQMRCTGRRVFWTKRGRLGLGPRAMRPGDLLYALHGGRVPFVLRLCNGYYTLIGEAYVRDDDIMWGDYAERLSGSVRRIEIRKGEPFHLLNEDIYKCLFPRLERNTMMLSRSLTLLISSGS
ncbi:HET-domain-containing protein [Patellaria atrata CBS 101060]|uniref:HET-domain-containing protein n=1 Tax=Patellaria atrata CBS 101060 TaxID=1346257 RepID=A0A9P4VSJ5_9PEZI|nr:HET-domain-containing protein [Patellaria atrata CBS 101060]